MTQEQIKAAVLAECERLCPKQSEVEFYPFLRIERRRNRYSILRLNTIRNRATELCQVYLDDAPDCIQWEIAYRLLGLNKPPADPKWERLKAELKARNEAEVEAIKSLPPIGLPQSVRDIAYATGHLLGWVEGTMIRIEQEESK